MQVTQGAQQLVETLNSVFINPLLLLIFAVGFLVFIYGVIEFLLSYNNIGYFNEDKKKEGKQHMWWGIVGMFIMVSAFTIVQIIEDTFPTPSPVENPNGPGLF